MGASGATVVAQRLGCLVVEGVIRCAFDVTRALLHMTFDLFLFTFALHTLIVGQVASLLLHLPGCLVELPFQGILVALCP